MNDFFDQVERELVRAAAASASVRRRSRGVAALFAAGIVFGVAGSAGAATYLALRSSSIAPFAADSQTPAQRVQAGSSRVLALRAADPARGAAPWALRVSRSAAGLTCSTVGQEQGGVFGLVGLDHRLRSLPEANADACGHELMGTRVFDAGREQDVRTVVYGVVGADLRRVTLSVAGGTARTLRHTSDGGFLAVLRGYPEDVQPVVTVSRAGKTTRYAFASGGLVVPDPLGGRAWKLNAFAFGVPVKRGQRPVQPRYRPGCVNFQTARAVEGKAGAVSPPVCGMEPGRPGMSGTVLYFQTRRLSGDSPPRSSLLTGDWNHFPARTAVWGQARGHHRIVVRAPGLTRELAPRMNGAFLVLLPASIAPGAVSVAVDGRSYGDRFGTIDPRKALP